MLKRLFMLARIFSLDVVLGACVGSLFIASFLQVKVPFLHLVALALCVWLIYTADHLTDAHQIKHPAHSPRHRYHQQHFRSIGLVFITMLLVGLVIVFNLPHKTFIWGLILSAVVGFYFFLIMLIPGAKYYYKEFMIALLYTAGVFLSPISLYHHPLSLEILLLFAQYSLLALINLLIFAWYETDLDEKDGHHSFVKSVGQKKAKLFIYACSLLVVVSASWYVSLAVTERLFKVELLFLLMAFTFILIMALPSFFQPKERYRILGDAVFLFPVFTLFH